MANKNNSQKSDNQAAPSPSQGFPVPFTLEELQRDILVLYVQHLRTTYWMTEAASIWAVTGKPMTEAHAREQARHLSNPDLQVEDFDLAYAEIRETQFARCIEDMYQYAYLGMVDESGEQMEYESIYTWITSIVCDFKASRMLGEWDSYGGEGQGSAGRCLDVCELANARRVLEGHENFFYFYQGKEDNTAFEGLTVRQLALLSGMEEMSIRAAANPKRANPLPTFSEDGRTLISVEAAKTWLQAKGRYVPIQRRFGRGDFDLSKRKFTTVDDLCFSLAARQEFLSRRDQNEKELVEQINRLGIKNPPPRAFENRVFEIRKDQLLDADLMRKLARVLDLPPDLLALRARETVACEELAAIERELRAIATA